MSIKVYGYTKVNSEGGAYGRESSTELHLSEEVRNARMYEDYVDTFNYLAENGELDKEGRKYVDYNGNSRQSQKEFMQELKRSKDMNLDVFGLIQCSDFHVQFEPFCDEL